VVFQTSAEAGLITMPPRRPHLNPRSPMSMITMIHPLELELRPRAQGLPGQHQRREMLAKVSPSSYNNLNVYCHPYVYLISSEYNDQLDLELVMAKNVIYRNKALKSRESRDKLNMDAEKSSIKENKKVSKITVACKKQKLKIKEQKLQVGRWRPRPRGKDLRWMKFALELLS
jgi:hypothetical protein